MSITISPISQVRQNLLELAKAMQVSNEEVVVVSKSKPVVVIVPYHKWHQDQINQELLVWSQKSKQSFVYDDDEKDNYDPNRLKPIV